jgi:hypothetical protein
VKTYIVNYIDIDNEKSQSFVDANSEKEAEENFKKYMEDIGEGYFLIDVEETEPLPTANDNGKLLK